MTRWLIVTGGFLIWATHFLGVYTISSLGDVVATAEAPLWRAAALVFSGLCAAADVALMGWLVRALRGIETASPDGWIARLGLSGAGVSLVAVIWQSLPLMIGLSH